MAASIKPMISGITRPALRQLMRIIVPMFIVLKLHHWFTMLSSSSVVGLPTAWFVADSCIGIVILVLILASVIVLGHLLLQLACTPIGQIVRPVLVTLHQLGDLGGIEAL